MRRKVDVLAEEESLVQWLKLGEGDSRNDVIQQKLDEIFNKFNFGEPVVAAQVGKILLPKLFVTSTWVTFKEDLKVSIQKGYQKDSLWADILKQLEYAQAKKAQMGNCDYWLSHGLIEMKIKGTENPRQLWKVVIPGIKDVHRTIIQELHSAPYAGHLGYHKTLKKLQENFYWSDHTVDIRDFVLGCEIYPI